MTPFQLSKERLQRAKDINIVLYLQEQGYEIEELGSYYRCLSPLRGENNGSFDINKKTGKWKDRGNGKKGDIVDLVMEMEGCTLPEAVDKLLGNQRNLSLPKFQPEVRDKENIEILSVGAIITPYLWDYIAERKIMPEIASAWLVELSIRFPYGKYPDRVSRVLGFVNDEGGYEMRNKVLKICNRPKTVTTLKGNGNGEINLYEGFFSFLSDRVLTNHQVIVDTVVLNSLSFLPQMLSFWGTKYHINIFLDNDKAGDEAVQAIKDSGCSYTDMRYIYTGYNDLNDFICDKPIKTKRGFLSEILQF